MKKIDCNLSKDTINAESFFLIFFMEKVGLGWATIDADFSVHSGSALGNTE